MRLIAKVNDYEFLACVSVSELKQIVGEYNGVGKCPDLRVGCDVAVSDIHSRLYAALRNKSRINHAKKILSEVLEAIEPLENLVQIGTEAEQK